MTENLISRPGHIYYGWKVIAALFVVGMMVYGCGLYSFTLFIEPLTAEFGWSRAATSGLVSVYWLAAPLTLAAEPVVRRFGGLRLIAGGVILAALATFLLGYCNSLPLLFTLRFLMGVGKVMMASGVTLLAAHWFRKNFGLALACCYAGWHFGGLVMVPLTQWLISVAGWRETTAVLGILILAAALPPLLYWGRTPSPVARGLEPETGEPVWVETAAKSAHRPGGLAQVIKEPILWLSVAITVLGSFAYGAILTNEAALVDELAATRGWGSAAVSVTALSALFGALIIGWFADRLKFLPLILIEISLLGAGVIGFLALYWIAFPAVLFISAICFGLAVGGFEAAVLPNMRRLLSTSHFDSAFGVWYLCYLGTLFAAPIGAGWIHDIYGSYAPALMILLGTTFAAFVPALLMPRRDRPEAA